MPIKNQHVRDFVEYYCDMTQSPEYALLVDGNWGSGKTHLVESVLEELKAKYKKDKRFLFISLYGLHCIEDIDTKIFQLLNPRLSSKKMILAGRLAKGILKGTLRFDLDGDGKKDTSLNAGIPDIELADYFTDPEGCILVFDDVERSSIRYRELFGYINYFVEKEGYKVILIAEQNKLKERYGKDYEKVKEKLIGKTIKVKADVEEVFDYYLSIGKLISDYKIKEIIRSNKTGIIRCFEESGYNNLRSLRKLVFDLERLILSLDNEVLSKELLVNELIMIFSIASFEVYSGGCEPENLGKLCNMSFINSIIAGENNECNDHLANKYLGFFSSGVLLYNNQWKEIFAEGFFDTQLINESLKATKYFMDDSTPDWMKLWYLDELEEIEFSSLIANVKCNFDNRLYSNIGELLHVVGLFIEYFYLGLIDIELQEVLDKTTENLKSGFETGSFEFKLVDMRVGRIRKSHNLPFKGQNREEFLNILTIIEEQMHQEDRRVYREDACSLVSNMYDKGVSAFEALSREANGKYADRAFLQLIEPKEFVHSFVNMPNRFKREVTAFLQSRYNVDYGENGNPLLAEKAWLQKVIDSLVDYPVEKDKPLQSLHIQNAQDELINGLECLERYTSHKLEEDLAKQIEYPAER